MCGTAIGDCQRGRIHLAPKSWELGTVDDLFGEAISEKNYRGLLYFLL